MQNLVILTSAALACLGLVIGLLFAAFKSQVNGLPFQGEDLVTATVGSYGLFLFIFLIWIAFLLSTTVGFLVVVFFISSTVASVKYLLD